MFVYVLALCASRMHRIQQFSSYWYIGFYIFLFTPIDVVFVIKREQMRW